MADTIREFLVSLGYSVDKKSESDFNRSMKGAVLQANLLADAIEGAARTLLQGFQQMAQGFSALEYQAERTKNSVQNLRNVAYAFQQIGLSADDASSTVEGFAAKLRENPSMQNYLQRLGVDTKGKQGFQEIIGLVDRLKTQYQSAGAYGYTNAAQIASQFGIQEKVFYQLWNNIDETKKRISKGQKIDDLLGFDPDKAAKDWQTFMRDMNDTAKIFGDIMQKAFSDMAPGIDGRLKEFNAWLISNEPQVRKLIEDVAGAVTGAAEDFGKLVASLAPVISQFNEMIKSLTGEDGLKAAFEVFAVYLTTSWILRVLGAFGKVRFGWLALVALMSMAPDNLQQSQANGNAANDWLGNTGVGKFLSGARNKVRGWFGMAPVDAGGNSAPGSVSSASVQGIQGSVGNPKQFVTAMYKAGIDYGLTDTQARLNAAQAGLESGYGRHAPGNNYFGIKSGRNWTGDTQNLATTEVGPSGPYSTTASFRKYPNIEAGIADRVAFMKSHFGDAWNAGNLDDAIAALQNGKYGSYATQPNYGYLVRGVASRIGYAPGEYRRKAAPLGFGQLHPSFGNALGNLGAINSGAPLGASLSTGGASISQSTSIVVNGSNDPQRTADEIERKQNGVNSQLLRNTKGAVR